VAKSSPRTQRPHHDGEIVLHRSHCRRRSCPIQFLDFVSAATRSTRTFGEGFAQANPNLVAAVMLSASMDFHGLTLARVLEDVAHALAEDEPIVPVRRGLTRG
jgi:hypothetical protein